MSVIETRPSMFPVLDASQIETAKRFASGPAHDFAPGEIVFDVGERNAPAWLVLKGSIDVVRRDGLDHETPITSHGPGQFSGEVSQLAGAATLASGRAGPEGCTALPFDAAHVRALMVGSADIGEIMHARVHPSPRRTDRGGRRRLGADRRAGHARLVRLARLPRPQRLSLHGARRLRRRRRPRRGGALRRTPRRAAADGLPERHGAEATHGRRGRRHASASRPSSIRRRSTTWRWSARGRRASPPPSMPRPRACRCWCSTSAPSADRPALRRGSRTISAFRPASRAWRWPAAPSTRR